jgi:anti-anti-sigma regulatory factor
MGDGNTQVRGNVGIFSLFGKKNGPQEDTVDKDASRAKRPSSTSSTPRQEASKSSVRPQPAKRDAQAARATALKIDAIESEMSSEFTVTTQPGNNGLRANTAPAAPPRARPAAPPSPQAPGKPRAEAPKPAEAAPQSPQTLGPEMGNTTEFLLGGQSTINDMALPASEAAAVIEEAAVMYANGQAEVAEAMLAAAIAEDNLGLVTSRAWWMLFDLYQIGEKRQAFENMAVAYASKFESSPPAWRESGNTQAQDAPAKSSNTTPMVPFSGKLDASSQKLVERMQKLAETYRTLRLEFARVTEVHPAGCSLLLAELKKLQKSGHDLILVGAPELANKIRAILEVGRRDDTEDAWLLLLEILRLLNREKEFEETSIDYCVTFEVSPPAFVAPKNKVTTAASEAPVQNEPQEAFMMPARVEGRIDDLIVAIAAYSDEHSPAIVDCSQLTRVDFNAAGRLLSGLTPFCVSGKQIEFHQVNHLVAELFNMMGLHDIVAIHPRKT